MKTRTLGACSLALSLLAVLASPAGAQAPGPAPMPNGARVPGTGTIPGPSTDVPRSGTPELGNSTPVGTPSAPAEIIGRPVTPATRSLPTLPGEAASPAAAPAPATTQAGPSRSKPRHARPKTGPRQTPASAPDR